MKKIILLFITFLISAYHAQARMEGNTLISSTGYKIEVGQEINIGVGSTPDGDFKFIRRNSTGFGTLMISTTDNAYDKSQLSLKRDMSGHKAKIVKIVTRGNNKIGLKYEPLISLYGMRFEIDVDNAINSGEIVVPDEYKPKKENISTVINEVSIADEISKLKKLLDDGILTKEEYEVQKNKLLDKK